MAQHRPSQSVASLRIITYRLSSTPTKQLPHIASQIAGSLWNCKEILSSPQQSTKSNSEVSTLLHRFKTSLSSLLQDRTIEGRWAAVVLVKATIEAGGIEILNQSGPWIRSLLTILKKPDPPTTRILTVSALTRIFMLTWDYTNLIREITTPNLPAFISTCLSNIESRQRCSSNELQAVLEAFATLIPRHPTIFRTHESQTRSMLLKILSTTSNNPGSAMHYTEDHEFAAQRLFVLLHHCAPKQGCAAKWNETVTQTVFSAHGTCDHLFRCIEEYWSSACGVQPSASASNLSTGEMELDDQDALGFTVWKGVFDGGERLTILLGLLLNHIETSTAGAVTVPIGLILDLINRLLSVTIPKSGNMDAFKLNTQIPKDEREAMFSILPDIHARTLQLIHTMLSRLEASMNPVMDELLELGLGVFSAEQGHMRVRTTTYRVLQTILELVGPSMSKERVGELTPVVKACCDDLLPVKDTMGSAQQRSNMTAKQQPSSVDLSGVTSSIISSRPTVLEDLSSAAKSLLIALFIHINPAHLPRKLRVQMERSAVLTRHREAIVACVMNPAKKENGATDTASLLPLLAKMYPEIGEVEALLRPRMPVMIFKSRAADENMEDLVEDDGSVGRNATNGELMDFEENTDGRGGLKNDYLSISAQNSNTDNHQPEEDELYSASPRLVPQEDKTLPEPVAVLTPVTDSDSAKRPAVEPLDAPVSAKRLRPSSVAEVLDPNISGASPEPNPVSTQTSLPATLAVQEVVAPLQASERSLHTATLPQHPSAENIAETSVEDVKPTTTTDSDDDDLSDSEIPQLYIGSDTDPEEDDDEDDSDK